MVTIQREFDRVAPDRFVVGQVVQRYQTTVSVHAPDYFLGDWTPIKRIGSGRRDGIQCGGELLLNQRIADVVAELTREEVVRGFGKAAKRITILGQGSGQVFGDTESVQGNL